MNVRAAASQVLELSQLSQVDIEKAQNNDPVISIVRKIIEVDRILTSLKRSHLK